MPSIIPTFELDGFRFGGAELVRVSDFDPGSVAIKTQDADAAGDGVMMGRDHYGGSSWTFELFTNVQGARTADEAYAQALDLADDFAAVWRNEYGRDTPQAVKALRYYMAGRWRRVYGRPRRYVGPDGGTFAMQGRAEMTADFARVDHLHYDDAENVAVAGLIPGVVGGFEVPFEAPLVLEQIEDSYEPGTFTVGGSAPVYGVIEIKGPGTNGVVEAAGWKLPLAGTLTSKDVVEIDARPWARTVKKNGRPASGVLAPAARMEDLVLRPGRHQITYRALGSSASARATIRWRNGRYSL